MNSDPGLAVGEEGLGEEGLWGVATEQDLSGLSLEGWRRGETEMRTNGRLLEWP